MKTSSLHWVRRSGLAAAVVLGQLAEGDRVVTCLRMQGTQKNALMTIAPSGRKIDVAGITTE